VYLEFYGLREFPFNITPDPRFLYFTPAHREAYLHVMYGIQQRKGFIELTGEVGSGKTTLCRAVLAELGNNVETALVLNPSLTAPQLLRAILNDFGLEVRGRDRLDYIETLNDFLLEKYRENINVALIIDEAQNLSPELMEQVRMLSNLETDQHKLLQMVLCGQPELRQRLNRADLRQLRQRITVRYQLKALSQEETLQYIHHRLTVAGASVPSLFDTGAVRDIHRYAKGTPRVINNVCDNCLLAGYARGSRVIDAQCVQRAVDQLEGTT
jgi:general secretion pathway protein A